MQRKLTCDIGHSRATLDESFLEKVASLRPRPVFRFGILVGKWHSIMGMDRKIKKKKWTTKRILMITGITLFVSFILYSFVFSDKRSRLNVKRDKITIATVNYGTFQEFIPVTGIVQPKNTFYLDAIEGGNIQSIEMESGALVKQGDVILRLANSSLELSVLSQQASLYEQYNRSTTTKLSLNQNDLNQQARLAEIDFQLQLLKPQYERFKDLYDNKFISKRQYEEVAEDYEYNKRRKLLTYQSYKQDSTSRIAQIQQINVQETRILQRLEGVERILDNLIVRAPVDGQLSTPELRVGQAVSVGQRLGQVDILDAYKARVAIDELYLPRIDVGQRGTFTFDGNSYSLVIKKIYPTITSGRFEVDMDFIGQEPVGIKRGQSLRIRLELGNSAQALLLPVGGFYKDTGGNWVYVLENDGKASKRNIRLGRKNPEYFEVTGGLEPGDQVVTSSYENFGKNEVLVLN